MASAVIGNVGDGLTDGLVVTIFAAQVVVGLDPIVNSTRLGRGEFEILTSTSRFTNISRLLQCHLLIEVALLV